MLLDLLGWVLLELQLLGVVVIVLEPLQWRLVANYLMQGLLVLVLLDL